MKQFLFTYGTLLPGLAPPAVAPIVSRLRPVGKGYVRGILYDLGSYPGVILNKNEGKVWGQVYELPEDEDILRQLDAYEGFDSSRRDESEYVREECEVITEGGEAMKVWIYIYNQKIDSAARIENGDYLKWREKKKQHDSRRAADGELA
jgi:gamma-glutamylcyclotransferase (GGCT)/AIG2-like uncharacterized protein YtfP